MIAAAVFASHPIQTEPVAHIFARATLLAALFCLLSWKAWIDRRLWPSAAFFGLALLSKEEAVAFPAFLVGFEVLYHKQAVKELRGKLKAWAVMFSLAALPAARLFYAAHGILFQIWEATRRHALRCSASTRDLDGSRLTNSDTRSKRPCLLETANICG